MIAAYPPGTISGNPLAESANPQPGKGYHWVHHHPGTIFGDVWHGCLAGSVECRTFYPGLVLLSLRYRNTAFTLIELLIVVAIISLLSAIAVPNFLEAQTRAKVSRTKADLRTIATGLETYRTDYNMYPVVGNLKYPGPWDMSVPYGERLRAITTPVAYITSIPKDVFAAVNDETTRIMGTDYVYAPGNFYHGGSPRYSKNTYRSTIYSLAGRGPDRELDAGGYCMAHPAAFESKLNILGQYDATNGTVSDGDIFQLNCARM